LVDDQATPRPQSGPSLGKEEDFYVDLPLQEPTTLQKSTFREAPQEELHEVKVADSLIEGE